MLSIFPGIAHSSTCSTTTLVIYTSYFWWNDPPGTQEDNYAAAFKREHNESILVTPFTHGVSFDSVSGK